MVSLNLRLIGARIFGFRGFCQALIHVEPQSSQVTREGFQDFECRGAGRDSPELPKPVCQVAPGPGEGLLDRGRDRFGDVAPLKADLLAQEVTRPRLCPDLAGEALELGRAPDTRGQVEGVSLFDRPPLPFRAVRSATRPVAQD